jgi:hypothetical protein
MADGKYQRDACDTDDCELEERIDRYPYEQVLQEDDYRELYDKDRVGIICKRFRKRALRIEPVLEKHEKGDTGAHAEERLPERSEKGPGRSAPEKKRITFQCADYD